MMRAASAATWVPTWAPTEALVAELIAGTQRVFFAASSSVDLLPLAKWPEAQRAYIRRTIDVIENRTGVRSIGWSSPSVYANADTYAATAAEGIRYTLDGMDSAVISRLETPSGALWLLPYPPTVVDMGQDLPRFEEATDLERLWIDYVGELVREAAATPDSDATIDAPVRVSRPGRHHSRGRNPGLRCRQSVSFIIPFPILTPDAIELRHADRIKIVAR
jgi:hypothetical protein